MNNSKLNIAAIGDSVTRGYDGFQNLRHNYPYYLSKLVPTASIDNYGINGATIMQDLEKEIVRCNAHKYDIYIVMIGTNDYGHLREELINIQEKLRFILSKLMNGQSHAQIYGVLPLPRYDNLQNADNVIRGADYTFSELLDGLAYVYKQLNIPFIDWRNYHPDFINDHNFKIKYNDQHVHPNADTYQQLAQYIFAFINQQ